MSSVLVFSACSKSKDDRQPTSLKIIKPSHYLHRPTLLKLLLDTRDHVFSIPGVRIGGKVTEEAQNYQASFIRLPSRERVPYTANIWHEAGLPRICEVIVRHLKPSRMYVFGSQAYTGIIKRTSLWPPDGRIKMFESSGSGGDLGLV